MMRMHGTEAPSLRTPTALKCSEAGAWRMTHVASDQRQVSTKNKLQVVTVEATCTLLYTDRRLCVAQIAYHIFMGSVHIRVHNKSQAMLSESLEGAIGILLSASKDHFTLSVRCVRFRHACDTRLHAFEWKGTRMYMYPHTPLSLEGNHNRCFDYGFIH